MDFSILGLTLQIALVATVINFPLALVVSWVMVRKEVRGRFVLDLLIMLPLAVPPVAIGYLLLILLGREGPIGSVLNSLLGIDLVFTWIAAALASAVVSFPLMTRAIMVAIGDVDPRLELSARSLGAGPLRAILTVTIPLAYRGILAGVLLSFVRALSEFGATIVVAGNMQGQSRTLSVAMFSSIQTGKDADAIKFAVVAIALAVATILTHNWLLERTRYDRN